MLRWLIALTFFLCFNLAAEDYSLLGQSRALVADFQETLGKQLKTAMKEGGTPQAIAVCSEQAMVIAQEKSKSSGAELARVSDKARNPDNKANGEEQQVLASFSKALQQQQPKLEYFKAEKNGNALYMKGIVVQPLCLACHGDNLAPETTKVLAKYYPQDQARGYKQGDLRGAFVVQWKNDKP